MRWPDVMRALVARLEADAELMGLLGGPHIYRTQDIREVRVPSVAWTRVSDVEEETVEAVLIQWDLFARTEAGEEGVLRRLRALLASDTVEIVAGVRMWMRYDGGRELEPPEPGTRHSALDVTYQPLRER